MSVEYFKKILVAKDDKQWHLISYQTSNNEWSIENQRIFTLVVNTFDTLEGLNAYIDRLVDGGGEWLFKYGSRTFWKRPYFNRLIKNAYKVEDRKDIFDRMHPDFYNAHYKYLDIESCLKPKED